MRSYNLNIAGYRIGIFSADDGPELEPAERFRNSICDACDTDIDIEVHSGSFEIPAGSIKVFHAPLVEENDTAQVIRNDTFWSVFRHGSELFIETSFPLSGTLAKGILKFSLSDRQWELWIENSGLPADPFEYPLDALVLYYLTAINGDIMIHASGVNHSGKGYVFSGVSGTGKTTMARLWNESGCSVIHDDRLIIRNRNGKYVMYNTPVYRNDIPAESEISRIFLISHGQNNDFIPVSGAMAVSLVLANCIQHNWNSELIGRLVGSVSMLCNSVSVSKLKFRPEKEIIDFILYYE
jgi:hypothetical protein